ncbi:LexA family transcriptional regulator [Pseudomonas mucidolens]|uniref:Phage repressor protein C, contains Cro/C1-type HTH and peptisase s24 domains n=1 Tax=Pseudomonas mucidolens TaxID=46679 RepID=A0A1H2P2S4_9PSED|nr:helix-turn-helix transcriptional regulator [Pseudomonas mucidolens]SDV11989.1 Phage repressor protein C, contains Cro/C1-type HTH and peptisase s24 domains [Pseudomonas mucidolens]SQH36415.1 putative regulatory protein [Pseudomonas mucidolens]
MNTSGDRLRILLREVNLSASDFAKNRNVTPQHVNNWFKRGVPMARLNEIAELLCVTSRWLRTGEGPKHPPVNFQLENAEAGGSTANTREDNGNYLTGPASGPENIDVKIPLHTAFTPQESIRLSLQTLETLNVSPERALGAYMLGNSMIDIIQDGATLAIDRGRTRIIDGEIYALEHDGMLRIKYLYNRPGGGLRLRSHNNSEHPDEFLTYEQRFEQNLKVIGWVFWWSTLNNRRPPVPLDEHLLGWNGSKSDPEVGN